MSFVLWLNYYYIVFLDCLSLFLHYHTSLIKYSFRTCGRGRRLKPFYKQEAEFMGILSWKTPQSPAQFHSCKLDNKRKNYLEHFKEVNENVNEK